MRRSRWDAKVAGKVRLPTLENDLKEEKSYTFQASFQESFQAARPETT